MAAATPGDEQAATKTDKYTNNTSNSYQETRSMTQLEISQKSPFQKNEGTFSLAVSRDIHRRVSKVANKTNRSNREVANMLIDFALKNTRITGEELQD